MKNRPLSPEAMHRTRPSSVARPGWVYLVGAGPGDPGLITRRGAALLASADLVLYSEPIEPELLDLIRPDAEARSVGRRGRPKPDADEHHAAVAEELVSAAEAGRSAVRLHGGDPYLFSRGVAVAQTLAQRGVPFQVVPGVSSLQAAATFAGLPLTHVGSVERLTVVRQHRGQPDSIDFAGLRGAAGTICVLGAESDLAAICGALVDEGRLEPSTPAAVVCRASAPAQRTVRATLSELSTAAEKAEPSGPAVLVVGPTVELDTRLGWFEQQPLTGKCILVLRPRHQASSTVALLRERGAAAIPVPTIEIDAPPDLEPLRRAIASLGDYDLCIFTSANGVDRFFDALARAKLDARALGSARVAAIGPGTARALTPRGIRPDVVPERYLAEELTRAILKFLGPKATDSRVLLARALEAREVLPEGLRAAGCTVDVVPVYQTRPTSSAGAALLRDTLASRPVDAIMLTSSSTAEQLATMLGEDAPKRLATPALCSIGPVTTATLERLGLTVTVTAAVHSIEGLVDAMEAYFGAQARQGS